MLIAVIWQYEKLDLFSTITFSYMRCVHSAAQIQHHLCWICGCVIILDSVFCVQILLAFQKMNCAHAWCKVYVVQSVFEHVLDYIQSVCSSSSACCLKCIFIQCMHSVHSVFACLCILTLYDQYCMHGGVTQHLGCRLLWIGPGCQFLAHCYFTLSWWDR